MTLASILESFVRQGGMVSMFALILLALHKDWLVLGHVHISKLADMNKQLDSITTERDTWRALSLSGTQLAENLAAIARQKGRVPFDAIVPREHE